MESAALLPSTRGGNLQTIPRLNVSSDKINQTQYLRLPCKSSYFWPVLVNHERRGSYLKGLKASEVEAALTTNNITSSKHSQDPIGKRSTYKSTFPNGIEALMSNLCDETSVAELKLKVGDFEMHLKRNLDAPVASVPTNISTIISPTTAPPIPSEPMSESAPTQAVTQKSSPPGTSTFASTSAKSSKLAALEASGSTTFVVVSSPTVGTFRAGRTLKGKRQPPSCKKGDMIREGQVIGFVDQFGNELPVKSDVAGEVLKVLFEEGEPVGFGDPLVAVLPSFHGIQLG